jgi:hypothetical protein
MNKNKEKINEYKEERRKESMQFAFTGMGRLQEDV